VHLKCSYHLEQMPFDTQRCSWLTGVYSENEEDVVLQWHPSGSFVNWQVGCSSEWAPVQLKATNLVGTYDSNMFQRQVNFTQTYAQVDFIRTDAMIKFQNYFVLAVILVTLSYLGFFINPAATPARVALGIIAILAVISNYNALMRSLPPGAGSTWLTSFLYESLLFNCCAFVEQAFVNFAMMAEVYLKENDPDRKDGNGKPSSALSSVVTSLKRASTTRSLSVKRASTMTALEMIEAASEVDDEEAATVSSEPQAAAQHDAGLRQRNASAIEPVSSTVDKTPASPAAAAPPRQEPVSFKILVLRCVAPFRKADHHMRWLFPLIYVPFVFFKLNDVEYAAQWTRDYNTFLKDMGGCSSRAVPAAMPMFE